MPSKKPRDKRQKTLLSFLFFASFVLLLGLFLNKTYGLNKNLHIENENTEQKTLPYDIKRELRQATPSATYKIPVLLYHYVEYVKDQGDTIRKSLDTIPHTFETQIKTLLDAGYTYITAADLGDILDGKKPPPQKPVILTFDDGYRDFYTNVFPVLKKYGVKVTIYVVPSFLDRPNYMLVSQLQEVAKSGLVEVAAHTMHHIPLKGKPIRFVEDEVVKSKSWLEDTLAISIVSFAYPYGAFDRQAVTVVENAGFKTAASTLPGIEVNEQTRFFIPRIRPGARTGKELLRYLEETTFKRPTQSKPQGQGASPH